MNDNNAMKVYLEGGKEHLAERAPWMIELEKRSAKASVELTFNEEEKPSCDCYLYVVTPSMRGVKPIMNAVDDSNHSRGKTVFCVLDEDDGRRFTKHQIKSLVATGKMIRMNGGSWFENLDDTINYLAK